MGSNGHLRWARVKEILTEDEVRKAFSRATDIMAKLNRTAASLMHKYGAHGATDVSKFGLLGHAAGLAKAQTGGQLCHSQSARARPHREVIFRPGEGERP